MSKNTLKTASVLAFERKLDPSDALMYSGDWNDRDQANKWTPIKLKEKSVRGTISNRLKAKEKDPTKLDAAIEKPNLQKVDSAALGSQHDTLQLRFTLRVLPSLGVPSACNNNDYLNKLKETVNSYIDDNGFSELARRYATNLANGRYLWRNRICTEQLEVRVSRIVEGSPQDNYSFNGFDFSLLDFEHTTPELIKLSDTIAAGLAGKEYVLLEVNTFARIGAGQEVFPSQELILDRSRGDKSKTLYSVEGVAAFHSQKIGNAIRTIDTWYPKNQGPIPVEPYGSVTNQGKAYRQPKENIDFYTLLDNWLIKDQAPSLEQQHFVMAILLRGGVFGEAG